MDNLWWGYLHTNDQLQVKRFSDQKDIDEACASLFCKRVFQAFEAKGRQEAIEHINDLLKTELPEQ